MALRPVLFSAVIVAMAIMAHPALSAGNCTCRGNGEDVPEGQTICLKTASGAKLARCERVLNNTSWTILDKDCPTASLPQSAIRLFDQG